MNAIFDTNRFITLIKKELQENKHQIFRIAAIILSLLLIIWLITVIISNSNSSFSRYEVIKTALFFSLMLIPFMFYKNTNHRKKGIDYAMLPASPYEKFASMILISTLIVPLFLFISSILLDTILSAITPQFYPSNILSISSFFDTLLLSYYDVFILQTFVIFCNLCFRSNKILKTILSLLSFNIILGLGVLFVLRVILKIDTVDNDFTINLGKSLSLDDQMIEQGGTVIKTFMFFSKIFFYGVMPVGFLAGSLYKIKNQKY